MKEFNSRIGCATELQQQLDLSADSPLQEAMLNTFSEACYEEQEASPFEFGARLGHWVIRDDDLELFKAIKDTIVTLAGAGFVLGSLPMAGIVALILGLVELLRNVYRSGARLPESQLSILAVLKEAKQPVSINYLLDKLPSNLNGKEWDESLLRRELADLKQVHTANGFVAFVDSNEADLWILAGV